MRGKRGEEKKGRREYSLSIINFHPRGHMRAEEGGRKKIGEIYACASKIFPEPSARIMKGEEEERGREE